LTIVPVSVIAGAAAAVRSGASLAGANVCSLSI
jgi:hypothetical protein